MNIYEIIAHKARNKHDEPTYQIIPNPDFNHRKEVEEAIKNNDGYCCCALDKTPDTLCICTEFKNQEGHGYCHCQRYYKVMKCPTVCICGSTKFKDQMIEKAKELTLAGYIVTMPMVFIHQGDVINNEQKEYLDELHKTKISQSDLVYIVNVDGYIGDSTKDEIEWAKMLGKPIEYMYPITI